MKRSIFMYLFFFAALFIIFQYANEKSIWESQDRKIKSLTKRLDTAKDSISKISETLETTSYFSLQGNENAIEYIERLGLEAHEVEEMIASKIYDQNGVKGGNPIIPFEGVNGNFKVNKIKFLNHRWIQADFSDGTNWGEMILEYFFDQNNKLELTTVNSLLYSSN